MRREFSKKTRAELTCAWCGRKFDRGYNISKTRASRPQFCSRACSASDWKRKAEARLSSRFWSRVEKRDGDGCWIWQGRLSANGYGAFDFRGRPQVASRFAYELTHGHVGGSLSVCHSCDNPQCVRPSHLWLGTHQQNVEDAKKKGRMPGGNGRKGSDINTSKLSPEQVTEIKTTLTPAKTLAERFGVSGTAIYAIRRGRNWGWLNV